jgi:tetratricopeptide (TPR) repeat protein
MLMRAALILSLMSALTSSSLGQARPTDLKSGGAEAVASPPLAPPGAAGQAQSSRAATAASYLDRGNSWAVRGELDRAIADYDLAIASDPTSAAAYYNRGVARHHKRDFDGALRDFDRALQLDPRFVRAYVDRGGLRYFKRDFDGTISDCTRAIELDPRLAEAWANRGLARMEKKDLDGALSDFDRAVKLSPISPRPGVTGARPGTRRATRRGRSRITTAPWS